MSILHIVNKSPYDRNSLETCLRLVQPGSAILLIEDGVFALRSQSSAANTLAETIGDRRLYALEPDMKARGLSADSMIDGVELVDYDGFVRLTTEYDNLQSWL